MLTVQKNDLFNYPVPISRLENYILWNENIEN